MRIVHIDPDDIGRPDSGGGPVRTFEIYRRLAVKHDITVITPAYDGAIREEVKEGVKYLRLGKKIRNHTTTYYIHFYFTAPFIAKNLSPDIVIEDFMPPADATYSPYVIKKIPLVASVQWFFADKVSKKLKFPFTFFRNFFIKKYENFIFLTRSMADKIGAMTSVSDYSVIPNGVDDNFFRSETKYAGYILFLGRVEKEQKGVDLLIDAYNMVKDEIKQNLLIAGDGVSMNEMKNKVFEYGLSDRIMFLGRVSNKEKSRLLAEADFLAMPSRYETFGMSAMEAFASGKTALVFDIENLASISEGHAVLVKPYDVKKYAEALNALANDMDTYVALGEKARKFAKRYGWDNVALMQEKFYAKITGKQGVDR